MTHIIDIRPGDKVTFEVEKITTTNNPTKEIRLVFKDDAGPVDYVGALFDICAIKHIDRSARKLEVGDTVRLTLSTTRVVDRKILAIQDGFAWVTAPDKPEGCLIELKFLNHVPLV